MISEFNYKNNPRVIIIQKLYGRFFNDEENLSFPKHRYKKFIKDVVIGTIERRELILEIMNKDLKDDINENKTDILVKLIIMSAIYEFMYMHKVPVKVVISEYLKASDFFIENTQKSYLNAILDKASKIIKKI